MGGRPLRPPTHRRPGGPLPRRLANGTHAPPPPSKLSPPRDAPERAYAVLVRVSPGYPPVAGGLHTRYAPVRRSPARHCCRPLPLDLHVLGLPLAFILSQDQTLRCNYPFSAPSPTLAGQARSSSSLSVSGSPFRYARRRLPAAPPPRSLLAVCSRSMSSNSPAFRPAGSRPGPPAPSKTPGLPGRVGPAPLVPVWGRKGMSFFSIRQILAPLFFVPSPRRPVRRPNRVAKVLLFPIPPNFSPRIFREPTPKSA